MQQHAAIHPTSAWLGASQYQDPHAHCSHEVVRGHCRAQTIQLIDSDGMGLLAHYWLFEASASQVEIILKHVIGFVEGGAVAKDGRRGATEGDVTREFHAALTVLDQLHSQSSSRADHLPMLVLVYQYPRQRHSSNGRFEVDFEVPFAAQVLQLRSTHDAKTLESGPLLDQKLKAGAFEHWCGARKPAADLATRMLEGSLHVLMHEYFNRRQFCTRLIVKLCDPNFHLQDVNAERLHELFKQRNPALQPHQLCTRLYQDMPPTQNPRVLADMLAEAQSRSDQFTIILSLDGVSNKLVHRVWDSDLQYREQGEQMRITPLPDAFSQILVTLRKEGTYTVPD